MPTGEIKRVRLSLIISETLYREAVIMAFDAECDPEEFLGECIEAFIATRRCEAIERASRELPNLQQHLSCEVLKPYSILTRKNHSSECKGVDRRPGRYKCSCPLQLELDGKPYSL